VIGPLGFNNTYALGMREVVAARLGVRTVSDLVAHPELRFGFSNEFMSRQDGWPSLQRSYGLPQASVRGIDHDLAYRGLMSGDIDVIDLYSTDAEIPHYKLRALVDDRQHFSRYDAVYVYRRDAEARWPEAWAALRGLAGAISEPAMTAMNARAKIERRPEAEVAAAFLQQRFGTARRSSRPAGRTRSCAARASIWRWWGVVCCWPSWSRSRWGCSPGGAPGWEGGAERGGDRANDPLAGAASCSWFRCWGWARCQATVALFLYGLLPIVRNTHAGLAGVPVDLRQSAEALGLGRGAILRLVELPLASRSILAGIKSAAVINVGTATLGALVGAGGFGQPIFTGVRLDDVGLILEGAVPASLLALGVQALFDGLERLVVPRGLRIPAESTGSATIGR
jgi:osmoprotectant transport system permease protein